MLRRLILSSLALALVSCGPILRSPAKSPAPSQIAQLWVEPRNLTGRDLFHGVGGQNLAPDRRSRFEIVDVDLSGASSGYDLRDDKGRLWSVKTGTEAQPEIVVSRLLWAVGFHQPAMYYVPAGWRISGEIPPWIVGGSGPQAAARFRPRLENYRETGTWSWYENPFIGSREFKALIVANLLVNNWDFKTSNNKVFEVTGGSGPTRRYVVRDLGAALGRDATPAIFRAFQLRLVRGSKNDLAGFESQGFIRRIDGAHVEFDYHGLDSRLLEDITPADVQWTCRLFDRLTASQWDDAFRAAGYDRPTRLRFITKLREKVRQGARLGP
jgi:hypothetical protein